MVNVRMCVCVRACVCDVDNYDAASGGDVVRYKSCAKCR